MVYRENDTRMKVPRKLRELGVLYIEKRIRQQ